MLAAQAPVSGAWLNAFPLEQLGLKMSDNELMISAGLRLGCRVIHPHTCICGQEADGLGTHGLTCPKVPGRRVRHTVANRLIHRALNSADYIAVLEPPNLSRSDGKRPDGGAMVPWSRGKSLIWDFSCSCTVANSAVSNSAKTAGTVAAARAKVKIRKYQRLSEKYIFVPLVVESHGPFCQEAFEFFHHLGKEIENKTGEPKATEYLLQAMSVAVQKGNALSILGTTGGCELEDCLGDIIAVL